MTGATTINAVMRTLADPTRRAVFERVVMSDEIAVVELTRGSGETQGASLKFDTQDIVQMRDPHRSRRRPPRLHP